MAATVRVLRLAAFPDGADGGNPAGVVLDAAELAAAQMQHVAAVVGYAETAFVTSPVGQTDGSVSVRYFSPVAEVPFCGHATIAAAVALSQLHGFGELAIRAPAGVFTVGTSATSDGVSAHFTSAVPRVVPMPTGDLRALLELLDLRQEDLEPHHSPSLADAGNQHPIIVLADRQKFDALSFDPVALRSLMLDRGWLATVTVLFGSGPADFEARNLFPVGTMDEDPATGSAAAAVGGYLRALGLRRPPASVTIRQGHHLGLPCRLDVAIPSSGGITVSGSARDLAAPLDVPIEPAHSAPE